MILGIILPFVLATSFMGQSIGVYGGVNFNHGDYGVKLDDGPEQMCVPRQVEGRMIGPSD
jgi:hypothetical protein